MSRVATGTILAAVALASISGSPAPAEQNATSGPVLEAARKAAFDGRWLLIQNRLDEAISKLELALELSPDYAEARQLLEQAKARRTHAQQYLDKAASLAKQARWNEALAEADAALGVYPNFAQAKTLRDDTRQKAADAHLTAGNSLLAAGKLAGAEEAFRQAMEYVADLPAARDGLARAAWARAQTATANGRWGAAYLWAVEAASLAPSRTEYKDRVRQARAGALLRVATTVGPQRDAGVVPSAATAALRTATWSRLAETKAEFIIPVLEGGAAIAYAVRIEAGTIDVRGGMTRMENRVHHYTIEREEVNPEYLRLRDLLAASTDVLNRLRLEYNRPCAVCRGTGFTMCRACGGTGLGPAGPCPVCTVPLGRPGWVRCAACGGDGRWSNISLTELRRQEREVADIQARLARQPATIRRLTPADWPYVIEYHERTGSMEASVQVTRCATGESICADAIRRHRRAEDTTIQNPNAEIGLRPDPLDLPTDEEVRQSLLNDAAQELADRILAALATARSAELQAESHHMFAAGKVIEAVEAAAAAAILKERTNPAVAQVQMTQLRERLRIEERSAAAATGSQAGPAESPAAGPASPMPSVPPPPSLPPTVPPDRP